MMRQIPKAPKESNAALLIRMQVDGEKNRTVMDWVRKTQAEIKFLQFEAYKAAGFTSEQAFELCKMAEK